MVTIKPQRVVGYARVSSEGQLDNTSINEQKTRIKAFCTAQGYQLVKFFSEQQTGSSIEKRPVYQQMIEYVTNSDNSIDAIIVLKADRIHRKLKNLLIMIEDILEPHDVAFISVENQFDTSTAQGMLFLQMLGSFAEFERKQINDRTRSGRIVTAKSGGYAGGEPPYGYKAGIKGLEIDPETVPIVKRIFSLYLSDNSLAKIAKALTNDGIATKSGRAWSKQSVGYILKNPTYTGKIHYNGSAEKNGIITSGEHEAIVTKTTFTRVQNKLSKSRKR